MNNKSVIFLGFIFSIFCSCSNISPFSDKLILKYSFKGKGISEWKKEIKIIENEFLVKFDKGSFTIEDSVKKIPFFIKGTMNLYIENDLISVDITKGDNKNRFKLFSVDSLNRTKIPGLFSFDQKPLIFNINCKYEEDGFLEIDGVKFEYFLFKGIEENMKRKNSYQFMIDKKRFIPLKITVISYDKMFDNEIVGEMELALEDIG